MDTFETVKNNVFDMLGDLAQDFNNEQLDVLFSKFEDCNVRPVPDAMKIMDLMRRLAKCDTKVQVHATYQSQGVHCRSLAAIIQDCDAVALCKGKC